MRRLRSPSPFRHVVALAILLPFLAVACASLPPQKVLVLSAITLEAAGEEFIQINELWNKLYDQKIITPKQYEPWKRFAGHFKFAFHEATVLWKSAKKAADGSKERQAEQIIQALAFDLAKFAAEAYQHLAKPKGG